MEIFKSYLADNCDEKGKIKAVNLTTPTSEITRNYTVTPLFINRHIFETRYMTVYSKCDDDSCCSKPKTSVSSLFPGRNEMKCGGSSKS